MDLVVAVYKPTKSYPKDEMFGLTAQTRRSAVSIASNIAEGQGRETTKEFLHFLSIAHGSLCELETQLIIGRRLGYLVEESLKEALDLAGEVGRLLNGLIRALKRKP